MMSVLESSAAAERSSGIREQVSASKKPSRSSTADAALVNDLTGDQDTSAIALIPCSLGFRPDAQRLALRRCCVRCNRRSRPL
jgi:hypothetical protein